jgi:GR25 family glycosyltransferase involved in LPS biosynthesis
MNINKFFNKILVLNYDEDRKRHIVKHFKEKNIHNYVFIKGVDGRKLKKKTGYNKLVKLYKPSLQEQSVFSCWPLSFGEIGCSLAHLKAFKYILNNKLNNALVCEDDIFFNDNFKNHEIMLDNIPDNWDLLHFHSWRGFDAWSHENFEEYTLSKKRKQINQYVYKGYKEYGGTTCYGITYNTARCLITWSWPVMYAADGIVDKISETEINRKYWNDYVIHPFICEQSKPSLIDEIDNQCKDVKITRIERWKNYE